MAPQATEICYLTLKPQVELDGPSDTAKAWSDCLKTVASQEGYIRCHFGTTLEKPRLLLWFIDWESHAKHMEFCRSEAYGPFVEKLLPLTSDIHLHHMLPTSNTDILGSAPVIEFATFYDVDKSFLGNTKKFAETMGTPDGYQGSSVGETVEEDTGKHSNGGDGKGKAVVLCIGWESKEKHMEFRDSKWFGENIRLLREGCKGGAEMFHVPLVAYKA